MPEKMKPNYVIISPVRNEEKYIENTMRSVSAQTIKPSEWIIVNDGSTDKTKDIIDKYTHRYSFIRQIYNKDRGFYNAGVGVVEVFYSGFKNINSKDWDYIVKLDGDVSLDPDYFENILQKFQENTKLGIASGDIPSEKTQDDIPWGPSKIYRRQCFEDIGGIKPIPGWDLADVLSAQMKGWETKCFREYKIVHYRQIGSVRGGVTGGKFYLGMLQYRFGYLFTYTVLKALYRIFEHPAFLSGIGMILGYIYASFRKDKKYFDTEMIKFLREKQKRYLLNFIKIPRL